MYQRSNNPITIIKGMVIFLHIKGVNLRGESCESSKILGLQKGGYTI